MSETKSIPSPLPDYRLLELIIPEELCFGTYEIIIVNKSRFQVKARKQLLIKSPSHWAEILRLWRESGEYILFPYKAGLKSFYGFVEKRLVFQSLSKEWEFVN